MTRLGANVTGIDASSKNISIAKLHAKKNKLKINYICSSPEKLKIQKNQSLNQTKSIIIKSKKSLSSIAKFRSVQIIINVDSY